MAEKRTAGAPNIYPLGHPLRNASATPNVPTPQPERSRPSFLAATPVPAAPVTEAASSTTSGSAPTSVSSGEANTDAATTSTAAAGTQNTDAKTTEV